MVGSFYDIDSYVHTAIEQRDFAAARDYVYGDEGVLSPRDRELLLRTIADEEAKARSLG